MHVVACLPPDRLAHLRAVFALDERLTAVPDWESLANILRSQPVDLLVLDPRPGRDEPTKDEGHQPSTLLTLLSEFRSVPIALYTAHTREGIQAAVPLARHGVDYLVFRGADDTRERLRDLVDGVAAGILGERLLTVVRPRLEQAGAPAEMIDALGRLFRSPRAFPTVHVLGTAAGRQRGMLDRWLQRAGLAPAKIMIVAARVAWAYHYMQAPGNRLKALAVRLGYPDTILFRRHIKWMTGRRASDLRKEISTEELLHLLTRRILRDPP